MRIARVARGGDREKERSGYAFHVSLVIASASCAPIVALNLAACQR
jgi:hypothetical protein